MLSEINSLKETTKPKDSFLTEDYINLLISDYYDFGAHLYYDSTKDIIYAKTFMYLIHNHIQYDVIFPINPIDFINYCQSKNKNKESILTSPTIYIQENIMFYEMANFNTFSPLSSNTTSILYEIDSHLFFQSNLWIDKKISIKNIQNSIYVLAAVERNLLKINQPQQNKESKHKL